MVQRSNFFTLILLTSLTIIIIAAEDLSYSPDISTEAPLKCSRDYHCPSKCDVCRSGICTHTHNLPCTRDYHCLKCEVCRSGVCVEEEKHKASCTPGNEHLTCSETDRCDTNGRCIRNLCSEDAECGEETAECKGGKCLYHD